MAATPFCIRKFQSIKDLKDFIEANQVTIRDILPDRDGYTDLVYRPMESAVAKVAKGVQRGRMSNISTGMPSARSSSAIVPPRARHQTWTS